MWTDGLQCTVLMLTSVQEKAALIRSRDYTVSPDTKLNDYAVQMVSVFHTAANRLGWHNDQDETTTVIWH